MTAIRRKSKVRRSPRVKLLLDEGLPPRGRFKELNRYFDVKHLKHDYHLGGVSDETAYEFAEEYQRILITFNPNDFRPLITTATVTVIGLSMNLTNEDIDKKLTRLLRDLKPSQLYGQYFSVSKQGTTVRDL